MAVIEYRAGDHPAKFTGFRVDTTIGGERMQEYFSTKEEPRDKAKAKAEARNKQWREQAEEHNAIARLYPAHPKPGQVCIGLSARILREVHQRTHDTTITYIPVFGVSKGLGKSKQHRVNFYGYQTAYRMAVNDYCEHHHDPQSMIKKLYDRQPDPELFISLAKEKQKKYTDLDLEIIRYYLSL